MSLTTNIRPEDTISIDNKGQYVVTNVQPNPFGGPDSITYVDDGEQFVVSADRCAIVSEPQETYIKATCDECEVELAATHSPGEHVDSKGLCDGCKIKFGYK